MSEFKTAFDVVKNYAYDLGKNTTTDADVVDEVAINQSIENIFFTNFGERVFKPNFGSNLLASLFEAATSERLTQLYSDVLDQLQTYETRVTINKSSCNLYFDDSNNAMYIRIAYSINRTGIQGSLSKKVTL